MTPRQLTHLFTNAIVGIAVLIAAYSGNPWASCVLAVLFVFVMYPRWRRTIENLISKLIEKGGPDDRRDPQ